MGALRAPELQRLEALGVRLAAGGWRGWRGFGSPGEPTRGSSKSGVRVKVALQRFPPKGGAPLGDNQGQIVR